MLVQVTMYFSYSEETNYKTTFVSTRFYVKVFVIAAFIYLKCKSSFIYTNVDILEIVDFLVDI